MRFKIDNAHYADNLDSYKSVLSKYNWTIVTELTRFGKKITNYIEINTLEELLNIIKETKQELVVGEDEIIIYDGYIE